MKLVFWVKFILDGTLVLFFFAVGEHKTAERFRYLFRFVIERRYTLSRIYVIGFSHIQIKIVYLLFEFALYVRVNFEGERIIKCHVGCPSPYFSPKWKKATTTIIITTSNCLKYNIVYHRCDWHRLECFSFHILRLIEFIEFCIFPRCLSH